MIRFIVHVLGTTDTLRPSATISRLRSNTYLSNDSILLQARVARHAKAKLPLDHRNTYFTRAY